MKKNGKKKPEEKRLAGARTIHQAQKYEKAMHLKFQGKKYKEIAKICGVSENRVKAWFMTGGPLHDLYKEFCDNHLTVHQTATKTVAGVLQQEAVPSLETIVKLRNSKKTPHEVRYRCSADILDRGGHGAVQKVASVHAVENMTAEQIDQNFGAFLDTARQRLKKSKDRPLRPQVPSPVLLLLLLEVLVGESIFTPASPSELHAVFPDGVRRCIQRNESLGKDRT